MSKQSEAKSSQGYVGKPEFPMCSNCVSYRSDLVPNNYGYTQEKNIRCAEGEFAVKKMGTCLIHSFKQ